MINTSMSNFSPSVLSGTQSLTRFAEMPSIPTDTFAATATPADDEQRRKNYKKLAWAGFAVQMVGGALTLGNHPAVGLPLFIVGCAGIVYGEYKARN